jgi:hypothetical protein
MDLPTGFFIFSGLILMLTPLDFVSNLIYGTKGSLDYYSLIVTIAGGILFIIGLLAYHKKNIQYLLMRACQDVEQTGFGRGIGNTMIEAFRPLLVSGDNDGDLKAISSLA